MTYISACSGIEAASVAWLPLGWSPLWFSEIDPFCCALLKRHYPNIHKPEMLVEILAVVKKHTGGEL